MKERIFKFFALLGTLAALVAGVLIAQRVSQLSNETLSLAGGALFGCALGLVPLGVLLAVAWFALRWREASKSQPSNANPPVVIVSGGQALPWYPAAPQVPAQFPAAEYEHAAGRKYTIVGGGDEED